MFIKLVCRFSAYNIASIFQKCVAVAIHCVSHLANSHVSSVAGRFVNVM